MIQMEIISTLNIQTEDGISRNMIHTETQHFMKTQMDMLRIAVQRMGLQKYSLLGILNSQRVPNPYTHLNCQPLLMSLLLSYNL